MKNSIFSIATTLLFVLGFANALPAQRMVTWKGGAPGMAHEWNCPRNWSDNRVPDEFSNVVIPDVSTTSLAAPIISNGAFEVNNLAVHPNAGLTINKHAKLLVYSVEDDCLNVEGLQIKGALLIVNDVANITNLEDGFAKQ